MAGRKRSENEHNQGGSGVKKTAARKKQTVARTETTERVQGDRGGAAHAGESDTSTVNSSSRKREAKAEGNVAARTEPERPVELDEHDLEAVPSLKNAVQRDRGENAM